MKHLKRFNESESSEFYEKITSHVFWEEIKDRNPLGRNFISFTEKERDYITDISEKYLKKCTIENSYQDDWIFILYGVYEIIITRDSDEWYYVKVEELVPEDERGGYRAYYKCDQLEGLSKLFEDEFNHYAISAPT